MANAAPQGPSISSGVTGLLGSWGKLWADPTAVCAKCRCGFSHFEVPFGSDKGVLIHTTCLGITADAVPDINACLA